MEGLASPRTASPGVPALPLPLSAIDSMLTAQIIVAWAGEAGDDARLGWWRSDFVSEFGGEDLFKRLLPHTWNWAILQAVRETARRHDAELRAKAHDPDQLLSLFSLGFEIDERINERLQELKHAGETPSIALPGLEAPLETPWSASAFTEWVDAHPPSTHTPAPVGRRITSALVSSPETMVGHLVSALIPLSDDYPLPHFRRAA